MARSGGACYRPHSVGVTGHAGADLLTDLALILCVAAVTTVLFQRIRQPVVLGYLLAGIIVGPHTPVPLFASVATAQMVSEMGVILLMFSLGLEFSLGKLVRIAPTAGLIGVIECSLMISLGYLCGRLFAGPPSGPLHRRLRRCRYLHRRSDCYRLERPLPGRNCTS